MMTDGLQFVVQTLGNLFLFALLLRFAMQLFRAPFGNPFGQFVVAFTDFLVRPLRRVIPGYKGIDFATLAGAWLVEYLIQILLLWSSGFPFRLAAGAALPALALLALVKLLELAIYLVMGITVIRAVLSWVNPYSPLAPVIYTLSEPILAPLRRIIPLVGNVDLTPLVVFFVGQLIILVPLRALEIAILGSF